MVSTPACEGASSGVVVAPKPFGTMPKSEGTFGLTMTANPAMRDLHEQFLSDVNEAIDRMTLGAHDAPHAAARMPRYRRLVVAYDGSNGSKLALAWAREIAGLHGSEVMVANAYSPPNIGGGSLAYGWYPNYAELYTEAESWARNVAEESAADLREHDIKASAHSFEGSPSRLISRFAHDKRADLVVTGAARRSGVSRLFVGSTAMGLVEHAPCDVLVARTSPPIEKILAATDGSSVSYRAVAHALGLASELGAELVVQHVLEYPERAEEKHPEGFLKGVVQKIELPAAPPRVRYVIDVGPPATRILLRSGEEDAGLVVVGSHGRGVVERAFVGSVSRRVVNESHANVLVVKEAGR